MRTRLLAPVGIIALALLLGISPGARAATIIVDTLADDAQVNGNCTLREAIEAANTDSWVDECTPGNGSDEIHLEVVGSIQLTDDLPAVTQPASILGPGPDVLEIRGDVGFNPMYRLIALVGGAGVPKVFVVRGIALVGGFAEQGGGIEMVGGGIYTVDFVTIRDCWANTNGGGIVVAAGTANDPNRVTIRWSTLETNLVITNEPGGGGGLSINGTAEVDLEGLTLYGNQTLGADSPGGGISIGGGGTLDATVDIRRSTLRSNATASSKGGGIYVRTIDNIPGATQDVVLTLESNTITGNAVGGASSANNEGGGLYAVGTGVVVSLKSNVIANNNVLGGFAANQDVATPATVTAANIDTHGYNFVSEANPSAGFPEGTPNGKGDLVYYGGDPGLLSFGDYGGPTRTQPPAGVESAVVDQGSCSSEPYDQRGFGLKSPPSRPVDVVQVADADDGCDIGAVELLGGGPDVGPLADYDKDTVPDELDNCVATANAGQENLDGDGLGNVCDPDVDDDGEFNSADPDDDDDGLPDVHEAQHAILDPFDDTDAGADPDGDNLTSLEEYEIYPGLDPADPDTDGDWVDDRLDNAPLLANNACTEEDETFSDDVDAILVCGAPGSITVVGTTVEPGGALRLVSPRVAFESLGVRGKLSVISSLPCAACP